MRWYVIVTGILLIPSIIDFAVAAPLSVQEKHQARVIVANTPSSVTAVSEKRWEEELEKMGEEYLKTSGKSVDSSDTHLPSSSAPSVPDHASTNDLLVRPPLPAPEPASSTANPDPLLDPSCSPSGSSQGLRARGNALKTCLGAMDDMAIYAPPRGGAMTHHRPIYSKLPMPEVEKPTKDLLKDPSIPSDFWLPVNADDMPKASSSSQPPQGPALLKRPTDFGQSSGWGPGPLPDQETSWSDPPPREFYSTKVIPSIPSPGTESPTRLEPESDSEMVLEPSTVPEHDSQMFPEPKTSPDLPGLRLDHQALSTGVRPEDLQALISELKGKAKASRRDSGGARDIGIEGPEGVAPR